LPENDPATVKHILDEIYNFREKIPDVSSIEMEDYSKSLEQTTRMSIVMCLIKGIEPHDDQLRKEFNITTPSKRRYALSAKELQYLLNQDLEEEEHLTVNNVFYHLNILIEYGLVQLIGYLTLGNHRTNYYGRTSKFTVPVDMIENWMIEFEEKLFNPLINYLVKIKDADPNTSKDLISRIIKYKTIMKNHFLDWVGKNGDLLDTNTILRASAFRAFYQFEITDPEYNSVLKELKGLLME
jgi:hypothetical protein